jgi:Mg-chelatase subunit ChlD
LISLGKENTNLIKSEINKSYQEIIKSLKGIKTGDMTDLGPVALLSLYLLDKAKKGSRIFLCTDGQSNEGVGSVYNRENAIQFYTKIGKIANEKDIVISLIAFLDCESEIDILKHMVGWRYL